MAEILDGLTSSVHTLRYLLLIGYLVANLTREFVAPAVVVQALAVYLDFDVGRGVLDFGRWELGRLVRIDTPLMDLFYVFRLSQIQKSTFNSRPMVRALFRYNLPHQPGYVYQLQNLVTFASVNECLIKMRLLMAKELVDRIVRFVVPDQL